MDHQHAIEAQLAERYAFGDLPEPERDNFEEHLADCSRCLQDVRTAQSFAANAHAVFREEARAGVSAVPEQRARFAWWPVRRALAFSGGLNLALAGAALYAFLALVPLLQSRIRTLEAPSVADSFVVQGMTRGAGTIYTVRSDSSANFRFDLPRHFDRYSCVIDRAATHFLKTYNLRVPDNTETLNLTVPVAGLAPGDYQVRLNGLQGNESEPLASFVLRVTPGK
jgi:hypothetical protein